MFFIRMLLISDLYCVRGIAVLRLFNSFNCGMIRAFKFIFNQKSVCRISFRTIWVPNHRGRISILFKAHS